MGWCGGTDVFNAVADELCTLRMSDDAVVCILSTLIQSLQQQDWDTEYESLMEFKGDDLVEEAFRRQGVELDDEE